MANKEKKVPTYEEFMEMLAEERKIRQEDWAKRQEDWAKRQEDWAKRDEEWAKSRKEWAEIRRKSKETDDAINKMRENLEGLGFSNGRVAEDIIYNSLAEKLEFGGHRFDEALKGYTRLRKLKSGTRVQGEYDIVMINGDYVAVIEVKYRVRKEDVIKLVQKQCADFKTVCPEYQNHKILLGIGGLAFETGAEKEALTNGIGTFKLDGNAVKINDKNLKAY